MKILLAEDNQFYRIALEATLREWGYQVIAVGDGSAALRALEADDSPKMAILDWMMPKADGLEVCRRVRALARPEPTYIIILTAKGGKENIVSALANGADDYVTKPFDREELQARLQVGRRIVGLQTSQTVVYTLARAVEAKSPFTQGHSDRVAAYAAWLAERAGLSAADQRLVRTGAFVHDIGKISIPDAILNKPGALTDEEYTIIQQHPEQGVRMIESLQSLAECIPMVRWHHERLDGSGYPDGLRGDAIPLLVRALSIADSYDAMSSVRPYRAPLPHSECLRRLRRDVELGRLDGELVELFSAIPGPQYIPPAEPVSLSPTLATAAY